MKYYFSYTVQNPSPAYHDFTGEVDDSESDGKTVSIPWKDINPKNGDSNDNTTRQRRSVEEAGNWNVTASLYGTVVGDRGHQNDFELTVANEYKEYGYEYEESAASLVVNPDKIVQLSALALAIILPVSRRFSCLQWNRDNIRHFITP